MTRTEKYAALRARLAYENALHKINEEDEDDALEEWEEEDE